MFKRIYEDKFSFEQKVSILLVLIVIHLLDYNYIKLSDSNWEILKKERAQMPILYQ